MAESYSVTAVLSAQDKNFSSVFGSAQSAADSLAGKLKSGLGFGVLVGIGQKAFSAVTSAASGFTSELENTSAAWQTFEKNATMNGHTAKDIAATKKELQSFAQQTIYSASDMATTYAQLDAVGIKSAESLVKGFGGIASAAENPQQAMKTLSQQGVQMAAKPTIAWQDFKLMLEQTPAGIAAVASEMGMSTSEMVQAVQNGEIATNDFFEAVQKVGTSDAFTELATSYKTTGQALDGLSETVTNTLMPSFELFQGRAIKAVEKVIEKVESFNGEKIANTIGGIFDAFDSGGITGAIEEITGLLDKLPDGFKQAGAAVGALTAVNLVNSVLDSEVWKAGVAGIGMVTQKVGTVPGIVSKALSSAGGKAQGIFGTIAKAGSGVWDKFAGDSVLGKVVGKVGGFAGKIGGALGQVGGVILNVGGKLASGLQAMMGVALQALMPAAMIGAALAGLGLLQEKFGEQINGILSMVQEKGPEIISNFANGISSRVPELISQGSTLVTKLLNTIGALAPNAVAAGAQIISSLVGGVAQNAPQLISGAVTAVGGFLSGILSALPSLITSGMQLLLGVAQGISQNLPRMAQGAVQAIQSFAQNFMANLPTILSTAGQIVVTLVQGITSALPTLVSGAVSIIGTLAQGFIQNLPQIIQTGVQVIASLALGIVSGIGTLIGMIPQLFGMVKGTIMNTDWLDVGSKIVTAIGDGIAGAIGGIGGKIGEFFGGLGDWIAGGQKGGADYITASSNAIAMGAPTVTGAAQETAASASAASTASFLTGGTLGGQNLMTGFSTGIWNNSGLVTESATSAMASATDILSDSSIQSDADTAGQDLVQSAASGIDSGASSAQSAVQSTMTSALSAITEGSAEAQSAGEAVGAAAAAGLASGMESMGEAARTAISSVVSSMRSGLSAMQSAGQQAGTRFAAGIRSGLTQAASAARGSVSGIISSLRSAVSPAQAAGRTAGSGFAAGIRSGGAAARSAGASAGNGTVAGMRSGSSGARSAGSSAGSNFASGVSSKSGSARSAGSKLAHAAKSGMKGVSTSSIGRDMGQGLANGINSKYGAVSSAAHRLAAAAASAMRAAARVHSPSKVTTEIGEYVGAGLAVGMENSQARVAQAGAGTMSTALDAMRAEAQIASPSKKTKQIGGYMITGLINGVYSKSKSWGTVASKTVNSFLTRLKKSFGSGIKTTATAIANSFKTTMNARTKSISESAAGIISSTTTKAVNQAKAQQSKYQKLYDSAIKAQREAEKKQKEYERKANKKHSRKSKRRAAAASAKEQAALAKGYKYAAAQYKKATDKYKNYASSYTKAGNALKTAFTSAFTAKANAAVTATTNAITKLGETYQNKYNEIVNARTKFRDKMREISIGEYDSETKKVVALTDYSVAARQVKQYGTNLEKLKKILPQSMMNEILEMDTEEGLAYTQKLLSKGTAWLKNYAKSYNSYLSATTSVSNKYYQNQIDTLKKNYTTAVQNEFKKLKSSLNTIGKQVMQGFADGMKSKKTALDSTGKTLADSLIKTLKAKLKIKSPSRVMKSIGQYTGEGFVNGVDDEVRAAREAMARLVETPAPQLAMASGAENMRLDENYNYSSNRHYTFEAVTTLNGREIARSTAEYNEVELERLRRNSERLKGRR